MFITEKDVRRINALADMVNESRIEGQKSTMAGQLEDGTTYKIYHMGKEIKAIRIDFKLKEE